MGENDVATQPEIGYALAHGDWQTVLRTYLDAGLSQSAIAARTGVSQSQISRLASGRSRDPGLASIRALCDGLGIPRRLAGLIDREEEDTDRRKFLAGSLAAAATTALAVDEPDERLVMATSTAYRQLEQRTPTRLLVDSVAAHLALGRRLAERATGRRQARLFAAVAETAGLAGWLHADLVEPAKARRAYQLSITAADRSGQPLLTAYMQGSLGQYATQAGDPAQGLRLVRAAAGMPGMAASAFAEAAPVRSPKQAAAVTVEHARALAAGGEVFEACRLALSAYDTGQRYGSERVRQAVRDFRAQLPTSTATAELDERLHCLYRGRA